MLKFFFWTLLLANAVLAAYQFGHFDDMVSNGREPARMTKQFNIEHLQLVATPDTKPASPNSEEKETAVSAAQTEPAPEQEPVVVACTEVGNFSVEDARRFTTVIGAVVPDDRVTQRALREITSHIVYLPPQGDREGAEKRANELRGLGITDFFIIQDNSSLRWGVSLGVFKQESAARLHLQRLSQKGVRGARVGQRTTASGLTVFQLRDLDASSRLALEKIKANFPRQEIRQCRSE